MLPDNAHHKKGLTLSTCSKKLEPLQQVLGRLARDGNLSCVFAIFEQTLRSEFHKTQQSTKPNEKMHAQSPTSIDLSNFNFQG